MTEITFRVTSIVMKNDVIKNMDKVRLNLTQRPHHIHEDLTIMTKNLYTLNHMWLIEDPKERVDRLTLTIRSTGIFSGKHLLGYCTIDMKQLKPNEMHTMKLDFRRRKTGEITGQIYVDIYHCFRQFSKGYVPEFTVKEENPNILISII